MQTNKIYNEPCLETLKRMPNDFIDCVITSPPYWQLRDYGYEGQWGLEPTFQEYLEHLWEMMDEIYRVLKPTGTCWINLGDSYNNSGWAGNKKDKYNDQPIVAKGTKAGRGGQKGYPNKCLVLLPHRFAIGCVDRGWIMRNDIIWAKRNGMPEPVTDRFTKKHEYIFFMTKSQKYFFDLDSIRDKVSAESIKRYEYSFSGNKGDAGREMIGYSEGDKRHLIPKKDKYLTLDNESEHRQGMHKERGNNIIEKRPNLPNQNEFVDYIRSVTTINELSEKSSLQKTKVEHWFRNDEAGFSFPSVDDWNIIKLIIDDGSDLFIEIDNKLTYVELETDDINKNVAKGKNCGTISDFWDITTKPSKSEHYASYNDELLKKPVLAGCPEGGLIYDPFMGTGSTAEVCLRAKRKFIGSEMSEKYIKIAEGRLKPLLIQTSLF